MIDNHAHKILDELNIAMFRAVVQRHGRKVYQDIEMRRNLVYLVYLLL